MSTTRKYFWLKLKKDFFKRHDTIIIEALPNGKDYLLFYLKLLVESIDHDGRLRFSDTVPYSEAMLSTITGTNIDIVRTAVQVFTELGMMEKMDDGTYFMSRVETMIGEDKTSTERVEKFREKKKLIEENKIPYIEKHTNNKRYGGNYYNVLERDSYKCVLCDGDKNIRIHHVVPYDNDDDETIRKENLITVCCSCHAKLHGGKKHRVCGKLPDAKSLEHIGFTDDLMKRYSNAEKRIETTIELDKELELELEKEKDTQDARAPEAPVSKNPTEYPKLLHDRWTRLVGVPQPPEYMTWIQTQGFRDVMAALKGYHSSDVLGALDNFGKVIAEPDRYWIKARPSMASFFRGEIFQACRPEVFPGSALKDSEGDRAETTDEQIARLRREGAL